MVIALFCTNNIQVGVRHGQNKANPMHKYKAQQRAKEVGKNIKTWQSNSQNTMYLVHNSVQHLTVDAYTNSRRLHISKRALTNIPRLLWRAQLYESVCSQPTLCGGHCFKKACAHQHAMSPLAGTALSKRVVTTNIVWGALL